MRGDDLCCVEGAHCGNIKIVGSRMRYRNNELGLVLGLGLGSGCDTSSVQVVQFLQGTPLMLCSRYDHDNPSS